MAGMVSLIRDSKLRRDIGSCAPISDELSCSDYRKSSTNRSPTARRHNLGVGKGMQTLKKDSDRVPKQFRKQRCQEIHPLMRRSVCTLLIAGAGIITGTIIILFEHFVNYSVSFIGIVISSVSASLMLFGAMWYCWSATKLTKLKEAIQRIQIERANNAEANRQDHLYKNFPTCDPATISASKWPTRRTDKKEFDEDSSDEFEKDSCIFDADTCEINIMKESIL